MVNRPLRSCLPRHLLLHPEFRYVPAASTNVAKTFARERARLEFERQQREEKDRLASVTPIRNR